MAIAGSWATRNGPNWFWRCMALSHSEAVGQPRGLVAFGSPALLVRFE